MGYLLLGVVGAGVVPVLYPAVKWYMVVVCFLSAPVFSVRPVTLPNPLSPMHRSGDTSLWRCLTCSVSTRVSPAPCLPCGFCLLIAC